MFFEDYTKTRMIYHITHITDLKKILAEGINYDDKISYKKHYHSFHGLIDKYATDDLPPWVVREKAIFGSMNYKNNPCFHSHTAVLALKVDIKKCWVANENKANQIYEPFILKGIEDFKEAENYLKTKGKELIQAYWDTSLSFEDNLKKRKDLEEGYDAEVMIFHTIPPENVKVLYLVSDHRVLTVEEWKEIFCI
ncbi:hypothetical protein SAMN05660297_00920 [Natronincola peptidivorans]|uniref:DarT domain-containing protein n=1 Tax=Natronincola peptidivorans TaxID=426128 RepID=A0A1I0A802_9FIRM|nr:hypothetical protein [Natronincola peptidivorans]SES90268.1 hypothetical protein SAMN05660297_00920 [Natronincola peptidivorans]